MRKLLVMAFYLLSLPAGIRAEIGEIDVNSGPAAERPGPENKSALWMESKTRATLLITDSRGRRLGVDPKTRKTYQEIPGSQCDTDFLTNRYTGEENVGVYERLSVEPAPTGRYIIRLRGLQDGPFEVNISALSKEGSSLPSKQLEGLISEGELKTFQMSYDSDAHTPLTIIESHTKP